MPKKHGKSNIHPLITIPLVCLSYVLFHNTKVHEYVPVTLQHSLCSNMQAQKPCMVPEYVTVFFFGAFPCNQNRYIVRIILPHSQEISFELGRVRLIFYSKNSKTSVCCSGLLQPRFLNPKCGQQDLNLHGLPLEPKSSASANSAMPASAI